MPISMAGMTGMTMTTMAATTTATTIATTCAGGTTTMTGMSICHRDSPSAINCRLAWKGSYGFAGPFLPDCAGTCNPARKRWSVTFHLRHRDAHMLSSEAMSFS